MVAVSSTAQPVAMQTGDNVNPAIPPATPALMKEQINAPAVIKVNHFTTKTNTKSNLKNTEVD